MQISMGYDRDGGVAVAPFRLALKSGFAGQLRIYDRYAIPTKLEMAALPKATSGLPGLYTGGIN